MNIREREARALARADYLSGKVNTADYPTIERYENEWWEERYLPLLQEISMTTMTSERGLVYAVIDGERDYQDSHTLREPKAPGFTTGDYITMMRAYVDKLAPAWAFNPGVAPEEVLHNMRKIAAIAVQCMEVHGAISRDVEGTGQWGKVAQDAHPGIRARDLERSG